MHFSVVVTCYNYGRYLRTCLNSILAQTHQDFDVIVVDDGSTDDTRAVMHSFLKDPRIAYRYQRNQGQAVAKNMGVLLTQGELVAFLDADDWWLPAKLERQAALFGNPKVGVVYSGYAPFDDNEQPLAFSGPAPTMTARRGAVTRWMAHDNFVPFSSSVVRRSVLERYGVFDETLGMGIDWDLWLRLSVHTEFDFVDEPFLQYRVGHANQMSKNWRGRLAASDLIFNRFVARYPSAIEAGQLRRIRAMNACTRARMFSRTDLKASTSMLLQALRLAPLSPSPYLGLLRNAAMATGLYSRGLKLGDAA